MLDFVTIFMQEAYLTELRDNPELNPYISILSSVKKTFFNAYRTVDDINDEDLARKMDQITSEILSLSGKLEIKDIIFE